MNERRMNEYKMLVKMIVNFGTLPKPWL